MKENLIHYRTCVCNINYHMVWSVKYRRKILNSEIEKYLKELVQQIAEDKGFTVHLFECGEGDHVHCFVSAPPKLSQRTIPPLQVCRALSDCVHEQVAKRIVNVRFTVVKETMSTAL